MRAGHASWPHLRQQHQHRAAPRADPLFSLRPGPRRVPAAPGGLRAERQLWQPLMASWRSDGAPHRRLRGRHQRQPVGRLPRHRSVSAQGLGGHAVQCHGRGLPSNWGAIFVCLAATTTPWPPPCAGAAAPMRRRSRIVTTWIARATWLTPWCRGVSRASVEPRGRAGRLPRQWPTPRNSWKPWPRPGPRDPLPKPLRPPGSAALLSERLAADQVALRKRLL